MKLQVLEKKKDKLSLEIEGETHTFLNLLRENVWKAGGKQASYIIRHPYLSEPKFIVRANDPKKTLDKAAQMIIDQAKEFENAVKKKIK